MLRPVLVAGPAAAPVSLAEARQHCRVDPNDTSEDGAISAMIQAATAHLDGYSGILGRCLVTQTWRQDFLGWGELRLPFPDVQSASVSYRDPAGAIQTVAPARVILTAETGGGVVRFDDAFAEPALDDSGRPPVSVSFTAGFGAAGDVPQAVRHAILIHVAALYDRLEGGAWQAAHDALLRPYRWVGA